jgi:hypothetical protein
VVWHVFSFRGAHDVAAPATWNHLLLAKAVNAPPHGDACVSPQPIANLFISMLGSVGVDVSRFGDDGTGPLPQLKE